MPASFLWMVFCAPCLSARCRSYLRDEKVPHASSIGAHVTIFVWIANLLGHWKKHWQVIIYNNKFFLASTQFHWLSNIVNVASSSVHLNGLADRVSLIFAEMEIDKYMVGFFHRSVFFRCCCFCISMVSLWAVRRIFGWGIAFARPMTPSIFFFAPTIQPVESDNAQFVIKPNFCGTLARQFNRILLIKSNQYQIDGRHKCQK